VKISMFKTFLENYQLSIQVVMLNLAIKVKVNFQKEYAIYIMIEMSKFNIGKVLHESCNINNSL
jgi:hypothetical protein